MNMEKHFTHASLRGINLVTTQTQLHVTRYASGLNLNYAWSFGSQVLFFFILQVITGILLSLYYSAHMDYAFASVDRIMTDINNGYWFRYAHANGATFIFLLLYLHIARGLYYQSYLNKPMAWVTGMILFILMMGTAFIGYVLPWGQMSYWGATVITSLVTVVPGIGTHLAHWIWAGYSLNRDTLSRFYSVHFLLPLVIVGLIGLHVIVLHVEASSAPRVYHRCVDWKTLAPAFVIKDAFVFAVWLTVFAYVITYIPRVFGHPDNYIEANPLSTPAHIVPEWYFTPFYAILRACPDKVGGAISMGSALIVLLCMPILARVWEHLLHRAHYHTPLRTVHAGSTSSHASEDLLRKQLVQLCTQNFNFVRLGAYSTYHHLMCWLFFGNFITLLFIGMAPAEEPYVFVSRVTSVLYFIILIGLVITPFSLVLNRNVFESTIKKYLKTNFQL